MQVTTFPLALQMYGWKKQTECHCGGIHKVKFINDKYPNYVIEWWVKYMQFKVTFKLSTYTPQTSLSKLRSYLDNFEVTQAKLVQGKKAEAVEPAKAETKEEPKAEEPKAEEPEPVKAETKEETTKRKSK